MLFDVLVDGIDVVLDWVGISMMDDDSATVPAAYLVSESFRAHEDAPARLQQVHPSALLEHK